MCDKIESENKWKLDATAVNVYAALVRLRNQELAIHWTRFHVLAAANVALIVATVASPWPEGRRQLIAAFGLVLTGVWWLFTYFGKQQLFERWDAALVAFEAEVSEECGFHPFLTRWKDKKGFIHYLQLCLPVALLPLWIWVAFWPVAPDSRSTALQDLTKATTDLRAELVRVEAGLIKHEEAIRQLNASLMQTPPPPARKNTP